MKVVRIYDDRMILYNNINWAALCSKDVAVEYCTFQYRKPLRRVVNESNNMDICDWELAPDNEYYVFLDTRWDSRLMNHSELISGDMEIPEGLISKLGQPCVNRVIVYTTYDTVEGEKLLEALQGIDSLKNKLEHKLLQLQLFQPEQIIHDIRQEVE